MNVLVAPDKFKGTLSSFDVCKSIKNGIFKFDSSIEVVIHPLADGGDGSIDILEEYLDCTRVFVKVENPIGKLINSCYLICKSKAYIELANASGLELLEKKDRNPLYTSTFGTGELIMDAINKGVKEINLFVGGSATNDAGIGIARALGFRFFGSSNNEIETIGKNLSSICYVDNRDVKFDIGAIKFNIFTDVENEMFGEYGAAYVYAKQKGATIQDIKFLDEGLVHYAKTINNQFSVQISLIKGGGAGGGIGAGLYALLNAEIKSGICEIMKLTGFEKKLIKADIIITGEGKLDKSSFNGKVVGIVIDIAVKYDKKVVVFVGQNALNPLTKLPDNVIMIDSILKNSMGVNDAFRNAASCLENMSERFIVQNNLP